MNSPTHTRRQVLSAATLSGVALAGAAVSSCSSPNSEAPKAGQNQKVELPSYVPFAGIKPDYPPTEAGVQAAYASYPTERVRVYSDKPGTGGRVWADGIITLLPKPLRENRYWQDMNDRLNVTMDFQMSTAENHTAKLATTMAGGDLPDFVTIRTSIGELPNTPNILKASFADLTEYLSGDAVKNYPSLAAIPPWPWKSCVFSGGIRALPIARPTFSGVPCVRSDLAKAKGLNYKVKSAEEYMELCRGLTEPKNNKWALAAPLNHMTDVQNWFGCPNWWAEDNGKFTCVYVTENFQQALVFMNDLYKAGVWHPDAFSATSAIARTWLINGTISILSTGASTYLAVVKEGRELDPGYDLDYIPPFDVHGGPGELAIAPGCPQVVAIKAGPKKRVEELLRIADWLAAPFGTEENTAKQWGIEGHNFQFENGQPVIIKEKELETTVPFKTISSNDPPIYWPDFPDRVVSQYQREVQFYENVRPDASVGLYSDAKAKLWPTVTRNLNGAVLDVITGRKNVQDWKAALSTQRPDIDTMTRDLENSFAAAHD